MYVNQLCCISVKRKKETGILIIYQCKANELTYTRRFSFFFTESNYSKYISAYISIIVSHIAEFS